MANLIYPTTLPTSGANFVTFTALAKEKGSSIGSVTLYCPSGLVSADGASFGAFDMGMMGDLGWKVLESGEQRKAAINEKLNSIEASTELRTIMAGKILKGSGIPGIDAAGQIYQKSKGIAINPNTTMGFQNMNMRANTFQFKMVADSQKDSVLIKHIHEFFRVNLYAAAQADGMLLTYPPKWKITFHKGDGALNPFIPQIYESFLVAVNSTFNASTFLTFADGAPIEVDVSLSFTETKTLNKGDINTLMDYV